MNLSERVDKHRKQLVPGARAVKGAEAFTFSLPVAVIADGVVITTNLTGLTGHLRCSTALASEPIERFLRLKTAVGWDAAFEAMSADDEYGEEFCRLFDEAQEDLADGAMATLNDLVGMTTQAKDGWSETPRRMLVVVVEGKKVESGLVLVDWVLAS